MKEWEGGQRHGQSERPDAGEMPKGNGLFRTDPINSPFEVKSVIRVISDAPKNGRETDTDTCGVRDPMPARCRREVDVLHTDQMKSPVCCKHRRLSQGTT